MRTIKVVADGVPIEVYDEIDKPIADATKELLEMVKSEKVVVLIGKNSAAIVRPSAISGINIIDSGVQESKSVGEQSKNEEQNIDMICDSEQ